MMKKIIFLILLFNGIISHANAQLVKLKEAVEYQLNAAKTTDTLRVPLIIDKKTNFSKVQISKRPSYIRLNNRFPESFAEAISIIKNDSDKSFFKIAVDLQKLNKAGNYTVFVPVSVNGKPDEGLNFTLIRPMAVLDTISKLQISIEGCRVKKDPFRVLETGRNSSINSLSLGDALFRGIAENNLLIFESKTASIPAGTLFTTAYRLNDTLMGKLDYGYSSGSMQLTAPELEKPVTVQIEIIKKRSKLWIIIATFGGIVLGSIVRIYLANRKELETVRLKGYELIERIQNNTAHIHDKDYKNKFTGILQKLVDSLNQKNFSLKPEEKKNNLETAVKKAGDDYNETRQAFDTKLKEQSAELQQLSLVFVIPDIPSIIKDGLQSAWQSFNEADKSSSHYDLTGMEKGIRDSIERINAFLSLYKNGISPLIAGLNNDDFHVKAIPAEVFAMIKKNAQELSNRNSTLKEDSTKASEVLKATQDAASLQTNLSNTLQYMINSVTAFYLSKYTADGSPAMDDLKAAYENWLDMMNKAKSDPYQALRKDLVDKLTLAIAKLTEPAERTTRGGSTEDTGSASHVISLNWTENSRLSPLFSNRPDAGIPPIQQYINRSVSRIVIWNIVQVLLLSLVLSLILFKTHGPEFIGKCDELITLFLLGFSTNITVESVLQLGAKKES